MIRRQIRKLWTDSTRRNILGLGYATPYLSPFMDCSNRIVAAMPADQGALCWPELAENLVSLVEEERLPFPNEIFDSVLMVHALETSEQVRSLLREVWRVMAPNGTLLAVLPNRRGIWAQLEHSPFGHGHPYNQPQIVRLMRDSMFFPNPIVGALYAPPINRRPILRAAPVFESIGTRWLSTISGVLIIQAKKQIYTLAAPPHTQQQSALLALSNPLRAAGNDHCDVLDCNVLSQNTSVRN